MKSKIVVQKDNVPEDRKYPWLGIADNGIYQIIVLFSGYRSGTIVHSATESQSLGYNHNYWAMEDFKEFKDQVILSNVEKTNI